MSDHEKTREVDWRGVRFNLAQILMYLGAVAIWVIDLFGRVSWWHFSFGVALLYAVKLRYDRRDLRNQMTKPIASSVSDNDEQSDELTPGQIQEMLAVIAKGAAISSEMIQPIMEAALGQRRKLEADGWSPTMAESMAAQYYVATVSHLLGHHMHGEDE